MFYSVIIVIFYIFIMVPTNLLQSGTPENTQTKELLSQKSKDLEKFGVNKTIPKEIRHVVLTALSYYPELLDTKIDFQFKKRIGGSVMQAQPKVRSLMWKRKENRSYKIKISRYLELKDEFIPIEDLPHNVLLGWIGHELGHIMDYVDRSAVNLMAFGFKYYVSDKFISNAEIAADSYAVASGLSDQIIETKNFVLNHDRLPEEYKNKIRKLYMSPGEIISLVEVEEEDES